MRNRKAALLGQQPFIDNHDLVLDSYPADVLDKSFQGGGVTDATITLVLPAHENSFSVTTSFGDEWHSFYESAWSQAAESLGRSDRIVVIGYSLPKADRKARAVLLCSANKRAEVLLCCGSSNTSLRQDFEDHGFGRVVEIGTFEEVLGQAGSPGERL